MNLELTGKRALITNAGRGTGAAIAKAFAEAWSEVVIAARNGPRLEAVAETIRETGGSARAITSNQAG